MMRSITPITLIWVVVVLVLVVTNGAGVYGFGGGRTFFGTTSCPTATRSNTSFLPKITTTTHKHTTTTSLYGILDEIESDKFTLGKTTSAVPGSGGSSSSADLDQAYEIFLADLIFSPNDPRLDIVEKWDQATDPAFTGWLLQKSEKTRDVEERAALKDLYGMIMDLVKKAELSAQAQERAAEEASKKEAQRLADAEAAAAEGRTLSNAEVLKRASQVDGTTSEEDASSKAEDEKSSSSFMESAITPEIRQSYASLVAELLPPFEGGSTVQSAVYNAYDRCDAQLIKILEEMAASENNADAQKALDCIALEQQKRFAAATEVLREVLQAGNPQRMEGAIVKLAKEGKINEPFLLLLEVNANQAKEAGATAQAQILTKLRNRAMAEKDKVTKSKEIVLLRKLLRTEDATEREQILTDAFTPQERLLVQGTAANAAKAMDGEAPEAEKPMPDVPPPEFIAACKAVLINFGNLGTSEKGDLTSMVKQIASEAEVVATRIYGQSMTPQEQQDRAWKEQTTSIFDLETMEIEAERMGEAAPWTNPNNDDILPGFDADGRMKVGGG